MYSLPQTSLPALPRTKRVARRDGLRLLPRIFAGAVCCAQAATARADTIYADGFEAPCPGAAPAVNAGAGAAVLLRGTVVTPAVAYLGEILVLGDTIVCAAASCAGQAGADTATVIETRGLIFPGLIDTHNYALFDAFDENDWAPATIYDNHNDWTNDARYRALVDAKQYLNHQGSAVDYGCELDKYGELKGLLGGTTSMVTHATAADRTCYGSLARTIDQARNDLGADYVQTATLFPDTASADNVCANFVDGSTHAYLVSAGEGSNAAALGEFANLYSVTSNDGCLFVPQTTILDGAALGGAEFTQMGNAGMSLVWLPQSDITLYGRTADVPLALAKGVNVALGTNGSITGSHTLLDALRYAAAVNASAWGGVLSDFDLVQMATTHAARVLALDGVLGSIDAGKKADLTVVAANTCTTPWSTLVRAQPRNLRLVMVGGVALYGDAALQGAAPATPGCESVDVCGTPKFVCVAESGGTSSNLFGQTLADIAGHLTSGLADYDAANLTPYKFSPLAPLVDCR